MTSDVVMANQIMTDHLKAIKNVDLLERVFGRFPSFHDAEVLSVGLDRGKRGVCGPSLEARIHVFEMTSEIGKDNRYVLKNHNLVHLRFSEIIDLDVSDFNNQNVLSELHIDQHPDDDPDNSRFKVTFEGIHGINAVFGCSEVSVESVEPYVR